MPTLDPQKIGDMRIKAVVSVLVHGAVPGPEPKPKINSSPPSSFAGVSEVSLIRLLRLKLPTVPEMPPVTMDLSVKRMKLKKKNLFHS